MEAFADLLEEAFYISEYALIKKTLFNMDNLSNWFLSDA